MKVAVASQDLTRVDAHFGWARHLMFYDVSPEGYHYIYEPKYSPRRSRRALRKDRSIAGFAGFKFCLRVLRCSPW